MRGKEK